MEMEDDAEDSEDVVEEAEALDVAPEAVSDSEAAAADAAAEAAEAEDVVQVPATPPATTPPAAAVGAQEQRAAAAGDFGDADKQSSAGGSSRARRHSTQAETTLEPVVSKLERFVLYETQPHMYLVGCDKLQSQYRVLKMDRSVTHPTALSDIVTEDPTPYGARAMVEMLDMIHEGNRASGGLAKVAVAYGIVGFVRFLDCFYLCLVTQRRRVGAIGGNLVYAVKATETFPIRLDPAAAGGGGGGGGAKSAREAFGGSGGGGGASAHAADPSQPQHNAFFNIWSKVNRRLNPTPSEVAEARYLSLFQFIDLTKDFFYSYTYDLTNSLQHNMTAATSKTFPPPPFKDMYAWNFYLTRELESLTGHLNSSFWVQPIIHGAFLQRRCSLFGRVLTLTVMARRSRHFAGTRYLKRGVSDCGAVANDVEVEQVVHVEGVKEGMFSSFVQMRGSIPTYWTQESSMTIPKPPIVLSRVDPTYTATQSHFADLLTRYSSPLLVLDLVKQTERRKREVIVGTEYRKAIEHINSTMPPEHKIRYCALDFSHLSKHRSMNVLKALEDVAEWAIDQVGFFCSGPTVKTRRRASTSSTASTPSAAATAAAATTPATTPAATPRPHARPPPLLLAAATTPLSDDMARLPLSAADGDAALEAAAPAQQQQALWARMGGGALSLPRQQRMELRREWGRAPAAAAAPAHVAAASLGLSPPQQQQQRQQPPRRGRGMRAREQQGVLRTNCIDCLDRTNVAQFSIGVHALGCQLYEMGIASSHLLESSSQVVLVLMELYSELGDHIALQYGGSEAHKKVSSGGGPSKQVGSMNKHKELLTSIRRYYSNAFTDRVKQDAMNLFLGVYIPAEHDLPLWELESDYYLHNAHVHSGPPQSMREYKREVYYPDLDALDDSTRGTALATAPAHRRWSLAIRAAPQGAGWGTPLARPRPSLQRRHTAGTMPHRSRSGGALTTVTAAGSAAAAAASSSSASAGAVSMMNVLAAVNGGGGGGGMAETAMTVYNGSRKNEEMHVKRERVRLMVIAQAAAAGQWWREALQRYGQARMWMHLGPPKQGQLPPRFDRIHEPHKLTYFDHYFALDFAMPISVVRDATPKLPAPPPPPPLPRQQRRQTQPDRASPKHHKHSRKKVVDFALDDSAATMGERGITIGTYVKELSERARSMLQLPMGAGANGVGGGGGGGGGGRARNMRHATSASLLSVSSAGGSQRGSLDLGGCFLQTGFVGDDVSPEAAPPQFVQYASVARCPEQLLQAADDEDALSEFQAYLSDFTVDTESVASVDSLKRMAQEGSCTQILAQGSFKGLPQTVVAKKAAAAALEQMEQLSFAADRGLDMAAQHVQVVRALADAGLDADGMRAQIEEGLARREQAQMEFAQMLSDDSVTAALSPLTTLPTVELYASFFDTRSCYREDYKTEETKVLETQPPDAGSALTPALAQDVSDVFVQLEEDLYASRYNQFMLFNAPGCSSAKNMLLTA